MEQTKFPSEIVDLPSKGYLYSEESTLSSGTIELKYPTAREEDILTSRNLIQRGVALNMFLESLIVNPSVNLDNVIIGDKNAILIAARILAYGSNYSTEVTCPECGEKNKEELDLNSFQPKDINFNKKCYTKGLNEFDFELPFSKHNIKFKFLDHKDEKEIDLELKKLKKISKGSGIEREITTRLKHMIISIDNKDNNAAINTYVDNEMLSKDSLALRMHILDIRPDIDMSFYFSCNNCGYEGEVDMPLGVNFFWPSTKA